MIKKSLAIALLSVTVLAMGACSSDDDDETPVATADAGVTDTGVTDTGVTDTGVTDTGVTDTGMTDTGETDTGMTDTGETDTGTTDTGETDTGVTDTGETDTGETDTGTTDTGTTDGGATTGGGTDLVFDPVTGLSPGGYLEGTLTALVEANGGLLALNALNAEGLDQSLNDASLAWTVILPNDAAMSAATGPVDVQNHIVTIGAFDSTAVTGLVGSNVTVNSGAEFPIGGGGTEPLTIGGHSVVTADLMVEGGQVIVHIIDGVLGQ